MNNFNLYAKILQKSIVIILGVMSCAIIAGCDKPKAASSRSAVRIAYDYNNFIYRVEFDLTAVSHKEMGRQYAQAIIETLPQFERFVDATLLATLKETNMTFGQILEKANALKDGIPKEYLDEIEGMGLTFSDPNDEVGNGRLSPNKIFVAVILSDLTESAACSGSAVFGEGSATGKTIVARNNDWTPNEEMDNWNALFIFHNAEKSIVGTGSIGELFPTNVFNRRHVFAASLDSWPAKEPALPWQGTHFPTIDMRYAIENCQTLAETEQFLATGKYAVGSVTLLADAETAHVLEYDTSRQDGERGRIRTGTSELVQGESWRKPNAIACVNSFLLPESFGNHFNDPHNKLRFDNFQKLLGASLSQGKVGLEQMRAIMGYTSWDGCSTTSGAIFRLGVDTGKEKDNATFQSIVIRLDTFEAWIAYSPHGKRWPYTPVYYKILDGDPFGK